MLNAATASYRTVQLRGTAHTAQRRPRAARALANQVTCKPKRSRSRRRSSTRTKAVCLRGSGLSLGSFSRARSHATVARPASTCDVCALLYVVRASVAADPPWTMRTTELPTSRSIHGFVPPPLRLGRQLVSARSSRISQRCTTRNQRLLRHGMHVSDGRLKTALSQGSSSSAYLRSDISFLQGMPHTCTTHLTPRPRARARTWVRR